MQNLKSHINMARNNSNLQRTKTLCINSRIKRILLAATISLICVPMRAQETRLIDEIRAHKSGVGLWWIGHNGWLIKYRDLLISTDIMLDYDRRINPPLISAQELASELDISFVTHGHNDHFNKYISTYLAEHSDCLFVLPESCLAKAAEMQIPTNRIQVAVPRKPMKIGQVEIEPIRAIHGNANFAIYYEANLQDCGYVIEIGGKRFLQPGDSYLLEDHLFLKDIDVLFFSPTEHNMYIDRSVILINTLNPTFALPQHHSTVQVTEETRFWAKGYPDEVKLRLTKSLQDRYHILKEGDFLKID